MLLFFILLLILFSIPAVQTSVAKKITSSLRENSDINASIDRVSLTYFGNVKINGIFVEDHHQDTLLTAGEVRTSILSFRNLFNNSPSFGNTVVRDLRLNMKRYEGEERDNLSLLLSKLKKEPTGEPSAFELNVDDIQILNSHFSYWDENLENPDILIFDDLTIFAEDLNIDGDIIAVDITGLTAEEARGLSISNLTTSFLYSSTGMQLEELVLETTESKIQGNLVFEYTPEQFSNFVNEVQVTADFSESMISSDDLKVFYDGFGTDQLLIFNTILNGTLNDFNLIDLQLKGMDRSAVDGDFVVQGIFPQETTNFQISGEFSQFNSNYYDLVNLLPQALLGKLPETLRDFGNVRMQGNALLTGNSLDADVIINTQLGSADADFVLRNFDNTRTANYKGNLIFRDFNIGRLVNNPTLGKTSFNLDVDGKGFDAESINAQLRGAISEINYNNYTYKDIRVIGNLRNPVFNGNLVSNDPNLRMEFNGLADISQDINVYDFEAAVNYADLNALNFVTRDSVSVFKGDVIMNMKGTTIDNAFGSILLLNTSYQNQNDLYYFEDFSIVSSFEGEERTIAINSPDVISGQVEGVFQLREVGALFENSLGSIYTNYQPRTITTNQYMEFDFDIYSQIVEIFYPEIRVAPNTFLRGRVESDESEFKLNFRSPEIEAFDNLMEDINLRVDNTNPIYNTFFEADSVSTGFYNFSEFSFINVTQRDTLFIRSEFQGGKNNSDFFNINLYHTINEENKSVVGIQRSDLTFKDNLWYINEEGNKSNKIVFENNLRNIVIDSLVMSHADEEIRLGGVMRDSTYKDFRMEFDDVDIGKITPVIDNLDLAGRLNGRLDLLQENGAYYPNTSLKIDSLNINENLLGNLLIDVEGNENLTSYTINANLKNKDFESLNAIGSINVSGSQPTIDLEVELDDLNMAAFSPLGGEAISNIRGKVSGNARVVGNYKNPEFGGQLLMDNAGLSIPYLNVDYDFDDQSVVNLTQQQFDFDNIGLTDTKFDTRGILDGNISHKNFSEWFLNLGVTTNRLLVLDTDAEEDALYYGTAFISGDASIEGPTDELLINVNATTERGTVFKIPLSDTESVGDNSYIHFLSPEEKAAKQAGREVVLPEVKGIEMVFDLDVTNDAEVEVVVDQTSGSTLRGRGAGNLLLEINTNGKFNMWGDFIAYEGVYNFKYAGLVQKVFRVQPGGNINWNGNPVQAELDVSAVYELDANPSVLLENPSVNRKIPVEVIINLQGQLAQPDITFDIGFPNASSVVRSELEYRIDDRASKELQALFLVTQGSFYSEFGLRQNAITGTLAERASSIVNDIFADEDGKFQVGVNYQQGDRTPDQQTVDRFGLTLSTQISDRVLINGQVGVPIGGVTESYIIGDVEIDFLLNEDGSLRAKVFNRENNIQFIGEEIGFTQGVGLSYSVDFDTFKELIRKITDAELAKAEARKEEEEETRESIAPDYINFPENGQN
ncbi:translocation/assembly module TamB domain-containing protein [Autumnicola psychrophila]|uniref:Translocation/assembly module TamB domain-containing protein n=1 Tax=Autumnicola psychrophila TaxID=3075592 RepID=A0ABU3DUC7_9FLAO|nr:translocation/assembly module TamB domain-containing protein [Zunongwangia sp. F225]MDT0687322.1 translocation/assembly module TamB domain-containing protein [Zunongwangia sp. F225]